MVFYFPTDGAATNIHLHINYMSIIFSNCWVRPKSGNSKRKKKKNVNHSCFPKARIDKFRCLDLIFCQLTNQFSGILCSSKINPLLQQIILLFVLFDLSQFKHKWMGLLIAPYFKVPSYHIDSFKVSCYGITRHRGWEKTRVEICFRSMWHKIVNAHKRCNSVINVHWDHVHYVTQTTILWESNYLTWVVPCQPRRVLVKYHTKYHSSLCYCHFSSCGAHRSHTDICLKEVHQIPLGHSRNQMRLQESLSQIMKTFCTPPRGGPHSLISIRFKVKMCQFLDGCFTLA